LNGFKLEREVRKMNNNSQFDITEIVKDCQEYEAKLADDELYAENAERDKQQIFEDTRGCENSN